MKSLKYSDGQPVRIGDKFNAPRWGTCTVKSFDRLNHCAVAVNTQTGETFDQLGRDTFAESDLWSRKTLYRITQPRQGYVRPVSRRILDEMKRRLTSGPEWATVATVDAAKLRPRQPLDSLDVYLHEATPDASRHPQLAIVERLNTTPVSR